MFVNPSMPKGSLTAHCSFNLITLFQVWNFFLIFYAVDKNKLIMIIHSISGKPNILVPHQGKRYI